MSVLCLYNALTQAQVERIQEALGPLRGAAGVGEVSQPWLKLIVRRGRVVGLHLACNLQRDATRSEAEWLDSLASEVIQSTGYGSVEAILNECGEVVSAQVTVSHDLSSYR